MAYSYNFSRKLFDCFQASIGAYNHEQYNLRRCTYDGRSESSVVKQLCKNLKNLYCIMFLNGYYTSFFFRDLIPLVMALQHNTWFNGVCGDGVRASGEAWESVCRVVRSARPPPARLSWRAAALRHDHAARLGHALTRARHPPAMHTIDFSQNHIEDKGQSCSLSTLFKYLI